MPPAQPPLFTAQEIDPFLAELAQLYQRHGLRLSSREPMGVARLEGGVNGTTSVRVRARFKDPEDGEFEEYGPEVYADIPSGEVEIDEIRAETLRTRRAYIEF